MLNLLHKKCKLGGYVRGQMPKNANVICEGSLTLKFALQRKRELSECKKRIVFLSEQLEDRESELQQIQHQLFAKDNTLPMQNECTKVENSGLR